MGDIINLRLARKDKVRTEKDKTASENRLKFGKTKSERVLAELNNLKADQKLDGHRLGRSSVKPTDE